METELLTQTERDLVVEHEAEVFGFIEAFKKWAHTKTDAPEYAVEGAALMALSTAAGDTLVVANPTSPDGIMHLNLYIILVGPSTVMRKSTVLGYVRKLMPVNQQTQQDYIRWMDDTSGQAFNRAMAEAGKLMQPIVLNMDEVAGVFETVRKAGSYLTGFDKILMKAYDHSPVTVHRTQSKVEAPKGAFVNIWAATTPEPLMEVLGSGDVESGLLPRFLIWDARNSNSETVPSFKERMRTARDEDDKTVGELKAFLYNVAKARADGIPLGVPAKVLSRDPDLADEETEVTYPVRVLMPTDDLLDRLWVLDQEVTAEARDREADAGWSAIRGRMVWNAYKLAALYAISDKGPDCEVELIDLLRALHTMETILEDLATMKAEVGADQLSRWIKWTEKAIDGTPHGRMLRTGIAQQLNLNVKDLGMLRGTMEVQGKVKETVDEATGKIYWERP